MPKITLPLAELRQRSIFLATPMYGGQGTGPFFKSVLDLQLQCIRFGVDIKFYFLFNESLITRARNYLVDEFLRSPCTHMLFIDADIDFSPMDVIAMLAFDKPIIGAPYPKKTIAWERIYDAVKFGFADENPNKLEQFVGDYVFSCVPGTTNIPLDKPVEVLELGTGFMMMKREIFAPFQAAHPELMFKPDHNRTQNFDGHREICAFFDTVIDPETKRYLSEDYMFCQYARKIGISTWLCPWMKLKHLGTYVFGGDVLALGALSQKQAQAGQATPAMKDSTTVVASRQITVPAAAPAEPTPVVAASTDEIVMGEK